MSERPLQWLSATTSRSVVGRRDRPYHVAVFFVVNEATWNDDVPGRTAIYDAFNRFVAALNACDGVEVNTARSEVVSGAEFTWQETQTTDEWNFANLSHREP